VGEDPSESAPGSGARQSRKPVTRAHRGRGDQRSRLLSAIVDVVGRHGYSQAKIGDIAQLAGVSRATFYALFSDKEACFLSAHREHAMQIISSVEEAVTESEASDAMRAAITALVEFARGEPFLFGFLTHEATLAGPRVREERERLIAELERHIAHARSRAPEGSQLPDLPAELLLGGVIRTLNVHIRRGESHPTDLREGIIAWIDLYGTPAPGRRWSAITPSEVLVRGGTDGAALGPLAPRPLPRGRHRLPSPVVKRVQRERILHATAQVMSAKGYERTTVADIVSAAGLSREAFYAHLADKREALVETSKLFFEQAMAAMAGAFFTSSGGWPERVWEGGRALSNFLAAAPSFAHLVFIESYAPDIACARQTDDLFLGFRIFLEDGYRFRPEAAKIPRIVSDAITDATVELGASYIRSGRVAELPGLLAVATYMILAPFTGVEFANEFVERRLRELTGEQAGGSAGIGLDAKLD
jgi:AcrR family transcriptional regulator